MLMLRDVAGLNQVLYGTDFPYPGRDFLRVHRTLAWTVFGLLNGIHLTKSKAEG